jgi:copper chaperone CopZ
MNEIELVVRGMTSRRCIREVTALLRDVPGVQRVMVEPGRSTVRLSGSMSRDEVLAALDGSDYQATDSRA